MKNSPKHVEKISASLYGKTVGHLMQTPQGPFFTYAPEWLATRMELSPRSYELRAAEYPPSAAAWGLPGFIADSLPDAFGTEIMTRYFSSRGLFQPQALDLLSVVGSRGMGAMTFQPETDGVSLEVQEAISQIHLGRLAREADNITKKLNDGEIDPILLEAGSSIGGARPKMRICIAPDGSLHGSQNPPKNSRYFILKFDTENTGWGRLEFAYANMARDAKIDVPETRLITATTPNRKKLHNFAIERFDRIGGTRRHYLSAAGFYDRKITPPLHQGDYAELLQAAKWLAVPAKDREQLFRRCVFNVLAHNLDDHFKNFGFCMDAQGKWRLSPAFDLCYIRPAQEWLAALGGRCTTVNAAASGITRKDILTLCSDAGITEKKGAAIIESIAEIVTRWPDYAKAARVPTALANDAQSSIQRVLADCMTRKK